MLPLDVFPNRLFFLFTPLSMASPFNKQRTLTPFLYPCFYYHVVNMCSDLILSLFSLSLCVFLTKQKQHSFKSVPS